jgi:hypothetical protein
MFSQIEERLGHDLPLSSVLHARTISDLAEMIRHGGALDPDSSLITLKPSGDAPPLFLMPHAGLYALCYRALADRLQPGRPVYALEPKGVDGRLKGDVTVDEQAKTYLAAIRRCRPRGPYFLGGLSGGGLIAWEIGQRLRADGEDVKLVVMFDTYARSHLVLKPPFQRFLDVAGWYIGSVVVGRRMRKLEALGTRLLNSVRTRGVRGTAARATHVLLSNMHRDRPRSRPPRRTSESQDPLELENQSYRRRYRRGTFRRRLDEAEQINRFGNPFIAWLDACALSVLKRSNRFFARVYAGGYYVAGLKALPEWRRQLVHEHVHVWRAYTPKPYVGRVALFRAIEGRGYPRHPYHNHLLRRAGEPLAGTTGRDRAC